MFRFGLALVVLLPACRSLQPSRNAAVPLDGVASVRDLVIDFPEPGRGTVHFVLDVPGRSSSVASVSRVQWQLWLQNRPFASGVVTMAIPMPAGRSTTVPVTQEMRFAFRGSRVGSHFVEARIEGEVSSISTASDETLRFGKRERLEVNGPPLLETPEG